MTGGADPMVAVATRPRGAVIAQAWRGLGDGAAVFSGPDGAPLRRAEKCLIDPLILRVRANPELGAAVLDAAAARRVADLIAEQRQTVHAAAGWFTLCKQARRRASITSGNAQELYFPLAFELAVTVGPPGADGAQRAAAAVRERNADVPVAELDAALADPARLARLRDGLCRAWAEVTRSQQIVGESAAVGLLAGTDALRRDLAQAFGDRDTGWAPARAAWRRLLASPLPYRLGAAAHTGPLPEPFGLLAAGLTAAEPQSMPALTGIGERPLDRSVEQRVRATLRRPGELPGAVVLLAEEVDRVAAPWGLLAEDGQTVLVSGLVIAAGLAPLDPPRPQSCGVAAEIDTRLRGEAYVLHARRCLGSGRALHPRQQAVVAGLRDFRRPYLARLWARLHGRDTGQQRNDDVHEVRELLTGVARSVSLDHRQAIKTMLSGVPR
jgi:hypothetical protein